MLREGCGALISAGHRRHFEAFLNSRQGRFILGAGYDAGDGCDRATHGEKVHLPASEGSTELADNPVSVPEVRSVHGKEDNRRDILEIHLRCDFSDHSAIGFALGGGKTEGQDLLSRLTRGACS